MAKTANYENHIVAYGNYPMAPGGQNLFDCPGCSKGNPKLFYNGYPGQLVAYTIEGTGNVPVTVGVADIPNITGDLYIGRFVDLDCDGVADDVQLIAGEHLTKCDVDSASVASPTCGLPSIKALSIDCVECHETYTVEVRLEDNVTRTWSPLHVPAKCVASYTTECCTCDDCDPEANCNDIICGLVDSLNGELNLMIDKNTPYPDRKKARKERRYKAFRGHANWFTYCLVPEKSECDCEGCTTIPAITGATVGGEAVELQGNLTPDGAATYIPQVQNIAQQLNCAFEKNIGKHSGFAFVTAGVTKCCPLQLHVNTCDAGFVLEGAEVCENGFLPLEFTNSGCCTQVDPETGACIIPEDKVENPSCWLAVVADPPKPDCKGCYLDKPWMWYGNKLDIQLLKDPNDCSPEWRSYDILESQSPRNFGAQIQWLEYKHAFPRGKGRRHNVSNQRRGWLGDFESDARVNQVKAKCDSLYCSYSLGYSSDEKSQLDSRKYCKEYASVFHIDSCDDVTLASWEEFFNALITDQNGACKVIGDVTCTVGGEKKEG